MLADDTLGKIYLQVISMVLYLNVGKKQSEKAISVTYQGKGVNNYS